MLRKETGGWKESMPCLVCGTVVNGNRNARGDIKYAPAVSPPWYEKRSADGISPSNAIPQETRPAAPLLLHES